jgi:site-specific DNA-methyltransferase (adenine-specific)
MILADLPYGTTACKWDTVIPFEPLWTQYKRLIKPKGAVVLFGSQPFTSALVMSNVEWFRYHWVWHKNRATGYLDSNRRPLKACEDICVFSYAGYHEYNPIMRPGAPTNGGIGKPAVNYHQHDKRRQRRQGDDRYPINLLPFPVVQHEGLHPTQKPVALLEYLIRTYTHPGETVLDNVMGSGSTGVACVNTGRSFVGIEMDAGYFEIAERRIAEAQSKHVQSKMNLETL